MFGGIGSMIPSVVLIAIGALVFATMVAVIWWAVFGDRSATRRCPACWHDLTGTPGLICGECGFHARDEAQLHQPRRRWRLALVTLLMGLGAASFVRWHATGADAMDFLPDRALILLLPWSDGSDQIAREASMRLSYLEPRGFDVSERDAVLARCLRGDSSAPPASVAWQRRYAGLLDEWGKTSGGGWSDEQLQALWALPCRITVHGPAPWPVDRPAHIHLSLDQWWRGRFDCRVTVRPRDGSGTEVVAIRAASARAGLLPVPVAGLPLDATTLQLEVEVERRTAARAPSFRRAGDREPADEADWRPMGRVVLTLPLGERAPVDAELVPAVSPELDLVLRSAFSGGFRRHASGARRFGVLFDPRATGLEQFQGVAVGLRIEVLEAGVPRRVSLVWWMGGPADDSSTGEYSWEIEHEDEEALAGAGVGNRAWAIRVTGEREIAARALSLPQGGSGGELRYYAGSFEVPLKLEHHEEPAAPRPWRVESGPVGQ